jgi:hypothetical protein
MISKERLVFDVALPAEGDQVGSFLLDAAGTALTSTLNGGKQSLDVNVSNTSLAVTATNLDIRDLTAASDSVQAWAFDGTGNAIGSTTGALNVHFTNASMSVTQGTSPWVIGDGGGSITVDATAFDIRSLAFATDKVDASGSSVSISGTVAVTQSGSYMDHRLLYR